MKYALVFFLGTVLALSNAHVPTSTTGHHTRETAFFIEDIVPKSWGVYTYSHSAKPMWFKFHGNKGDDLSLSLSTLTDQTRNGLVSATLHGPHAADCVCKDDWTGWSSPSRRLDDTHHHGDAGVEEEEHKNFPAPSFKKAEFEPFGVGTYIPVTACHTSFPATGTYFLEVTPKILDRNTYFTLGAGMNEKFSFVEIVTMPFILYPTYEWFLGDAQAAVLVSLAFVSVLPAAAIYFWVRFDKGFVVTPWRGLVVAGAILCVPSSIIFTVRLIQAASEDVHLGGKIVFPLLVHILVPLLGVLMLLFGVARVLQNPSPVPKVWPPMLLLLLFETIYVFLGVWQSYLVGPTLVTFGLIAYVVELIRLWRSGYEQL